MSDTILPSGYVVPEAPKGKVWVVVSPTRLELQKAN